MIPRLRSFSPLFEVAIIASLLAVGWTLVHVYGSLGDLALWKAPPAPRPDARQVARLGALVTLQEQYLTLANHVTDALQGIRESLDDFVQDRSVTLRRYFRETETLQRRLSGARQWLAPAPGRVPAGDLVATLGLDPDTAEAMDLRLAAFLVQTTGVVSNYLATLNITEKAPLTPELVQNQIARAAEYEARVKALAAEARARAGRIGALVERHGIDLVSPPALPDAAAPAAALQDAQRLSLRLLAGVFLLLAIVLFVSFYRRVVVVPMHQDLLENTASAQFQRKLDHFARLATSLAHEIRNPLTAISIRLFTLQKSLKPGDSRHSDTELIRNEIERLEQIVKNFLRLSRPSEPKLIPLTARPLLEEVRDLLKESCRQKAVSLDLEPASATTPVPFAGDAAQLKQVLINLVQNAAESITGPGRVRLRARHQDRDHSDSSHAPGKEIVLEVEDTGGGIPPDVQERLFDPFFSTKENGTGLGLPIAARIVDQHQGRMEFESRAGDGSIFRVILPAARESKQLLHV